MNELWPIYIPSKGRAGQTAATRLFQEQSIPYTLVLEPKDVRPYLTCGEVGSAVVLPEENRGVGYARDAILAHARDHNLRWYWMFDDDVSVLYRAVLQANGERRMRRHNARDVLLEAQDVLLALEEQGHDIALAGLEFRVTSWRNPAPVLWDRHVGVVSAINAETSKPAHFDPDYPLFESEDFVCSVLTSGHRIVKFGWLAFSNPQSASKPGGCYQWWNAPNQFMVAEAERVTRKWLPNTPPGGGHTITRVGVAKPRLPPKFFGGKSEHTDYPAGVQADWMYQVEE